MHANNCVFHCVHKEMHTLFLDYETQIDEKKYWTMFFNRIAVHMQNF